LACSYWLVPVRVDQGCGALDLMKIEWPRLNDTASLSDLIRSIRCRSDGRNKKKRGGGLTSARVSSKIPTRCGQVVVSGEAPVVLGRRRVFDGVQHNAATSSA
jgi:hypothetical protein